MTRGAEIVKWDCPMDFPQMLKVLEKVKVELEKSYNKFPNITTPYDGYARLQDEVEELWDEIKVKEKYKTNTNQDHRRREATHVAVMAIRFILDVCDKE